MKNDLKMIDNVSFEMKLNDMVFKKMQLDLEMSNEILANSGEEDSDFQAYLFEENYFFRRVLSVLSNNDIPSKACVGLFVIRDILPELFDNKDEYIGESDTDADIYEYVIEYGYRKNDELSFSDFDKAVDTISDALKNYYILFELDDEYDDE